MPPFAVSAAVLLLCTVLRWIEAVRVSRLLHVNVDVSYLMPSSTLWVTTLSVATIDEPQTSSQIPVPVLSWTNELVMVKLLTDLRPPDDPLWLTAPFLS